MAEIIQVTTERLLLRQWTASDWQPFAEMNADPKVMRYFPSVLNREQSDALARRCASLIKTFGWGFWAVEKKIDGHFIGFVGLNKPSGELPFAPCVEIGWHLSAAAWGNGFATEAAKAALHVGFNTLKLSEIVSFTAVNNSKSRAVMERLGMVEDRATFEHPSVPVGSELREHCLYRIFRDQWQALMGIEPGS